MIKQFTSFIQQENLFKPEEKILLAVSGGVDSVVMCELFSRAKINFGIAHCNFHLRGEESNLDEVFVAMLSKKYDVDLFCEHFATKKYAKENGISIEMAARDLRYKWFNNIMQENNYDCIATAHHANDNAETLFLNLIRGTGIAGLHGILPKQNNIIRPLLFASKNDITSFAIAEKIAFRIDKSNEDQNITRNKIRHSIVPLCEEINPAFISTMQDNISRFQQTEAVFRKEIGKQKDTFVTVSNNIAYIPLDKIKELQPIELCLFELLQEWNFTAAVVKDIIKSLNGISGKKFFSTTHRLIKDREQLIITPIRVFEETCLINEGQCELEQPLSLKIEILPYDSNFQINKDNTVASLDCDKLEFPLTVRKWKEGDSFVPFGMQQKKKLSDFFIDNKFSIPEKENTWLLCSGDKIVWIIGHRIDNRFRITNDTKRIYRVKV